MSPAIRSNSRMAKQTKGHRLPFFAISYPFGWVMFGIWNLLLDHMHPNDGTDKPSRKVVSFIH